MNYNITFILVMLGIFFQITLQRIVLLLKIFKEYIQEVKLRFFCPFFFSNKHVTSSSVTVAEPTAHKQNYLMNYNITFILVMLGIFFQITLQRIVLLLKIFKEYIQEVKLRFFCPFFFWTTLLKTAG